MRRSRMLAAAVVSACLTLGSVTTGWAAWDWDWSEDDDYISATVKSSTEYVTGQADAQGEILTHVIEISHVEDGVDRLGYPNYKEVKNYREEVLPVWYLNKEDRIYIMDLEEGGSIKDPDFAYEYGGYEYGGSYPDHFWNVEFDITGVIPEEDGSVQVAEGSESAGICFETDDGMNKFWDTWKEDAGVILVEDLAYSTENTTIVIEPIYPKLKEAASLKGHQPEDYVYLLGISYQDIVVGADVSFTPAVFIRFKEDGTAETPASSAPRTGVWKEDQTGWWIAYPDGSYLVNGWYQSPESGLWYYMGADGYMLENQWLCDPGSGLWYYLGSGGAMLTSAYTPDGYWVGADGVWAQ